MDWQGVIDKNRQALLRIVATMVAMLGVPLDCAAATIPKNVHLAVLQILRPAESALRRIILIAARGLHCKASAKIAAQADFPKGGLTPGNSVPHFALFDPRKHFDFSINAPHATPRISILGLTEPNFPKRRERTYNAAKLLRRLKAMQNALDTIPEQAKRLARATAKRATLPAGPRTVSPMRPGFPPGYRRKCKHEINALLFDCHGLAQYALEAPP